MYVGSRRPSAPEQPEHDKGPRNASNRQSAIFLALNPCFFLSSCTLQEHVPVEKHGNSKCRSYSDWDEGKPYLARVETVHSVILDGKGLKEHVEYGVNEAGIYTGGKDNGLGEEHLDWPVKNDRYHERERLLLQLDGSLNAVAPLRMLLRSLRARLRSMMGA